MLLPSNYYSVLFLFLYSIFKNNKSIKTIQKFIKSFLFRIIFQIKFNIYLFWYLFIKGK